MKAERHLLLRCLVYLLLTLSAACASMPVMPTRVSLAPTATPMPVASPTATLTPTPTPSPTLLPTPTPTPAPTLDPGTVVDIVSGGREHLETMGVAPLCLRWEDTDGDGGAEWLGLHLRPTEPPELTAFVLDGEAWYELRPLEEADYGLGEYPTCELEVRDVNDDGQTEILIWGHARGSVDLLHVFVWDGAAYALLASFEGEAGIRLENADGDLADEVVVRYEAAAGLAWEAVHTWDGANYGWTWERYDWFYADRPHAYLTDTPEHAVISFYLALNDRDLPGAYDLLGPEAQAARPYGAWAVGFDTTIAVEVGSVHEIERGSDTATVTAQVRAYDNVDGRVIATLWDVSWTVADSSATESSAVHGGTGWRLASATTNELERQEVPYYR